MKGSTSGPRSSRAAMQPRYPEIQVSTASRNPLTLVAAVRYAMRRAHLDPGEIHRFSEQALSEEDPGRQVSVCEKWVKVSSTRH